MCGAQAHLFGGGREKKRTCEQQCRRRKSRRTSPVHPIEAEWGSAPGYSSQDPIQNFFFISVLMQTTILLLAVHYFEEEKNVWLVMEILTDSLR